MSCTSCNGHPLHNCDCTTYQLPVGPTGAPGATGATGATGHAGAIIQADTIINQATTTTGSYETLYTYTLAANTLDEVGDILEINAYWSEGSPSTAWRQIRILSGVNTILGMGIGIVPGAYLNHTKIRLSKVTDTTASLSTEELSLTNLGTVSSGILTHMFYHLPNQLNSSYQTVSSLSASGSIIFQAYSTVAGDIHLDRIVISKLEKQ